jgi:hypothetical protein
LLRNFGSFLFKNLAKAGKGADLSLFDEDLLCFVLSIVESQLEVPDAVETLGNDSLDKALMFALVCDFVAPYVVPEFRDRRKVEGKASFAPAVRCSSRVSSTDSI